MAKPSEEDIVVYCHEGHPVKRGEKHCDSKNCTWVQCRRHRPPINIDPASGRSSVDGG